VAAVEAALGEGSEAAAARVNGPIGPGPMDLILKNFSERVDVGPKSGHDD
jgi:hypothetical protein